MDPGPTVEDVLASAARVYADLLGLRNHTVEISDDRPGDPRALMECTIPEGRKHIILRAREDFRFFGEDEQRHALCHELVHAHLIRLEERVEQTVSHEIGGVAYRVFWRAFQGDIEQAVDALAGLLAPALPYIDWGEG